MSIPKFVGFSTQKGGVGKTTLTTVMASYCHFVLDKKVAIMDCDYPQHNIVKLRDREIELIKSDREYMNAFKKMGKRAYPVMGSSPEKAIADMQCFIDTEEGERPYDFVFVDLPGTVNSIGFFKTIFQLNHVIIPIIADRLVIDSSLEFGNILYEKLMGKSKNLLTVHYLWNCVVRTERTFLYQETNAIIQELGMKVLDTELEQSVKFRKGGFRSTMFPMNKNYVKETKMVRLIEEINDIISK
jgi:chromosome partitioning protein